MKNVLKVFEVLFQVFLIIVIIINLFSIISVKVFKNNYPNVFGYSYFSVVSGSMEPTFDVGDEVIVKITKDVKVNDIITFKEEGTFVTHRLIDITGEGFVAKGDNNNASDDIISENDIVGKVILVVPFLGKIKYVLTNYLFIIILVSCYIIYEIVLSKQKKF